MKILFLWISAAAWAANPVIQAMKPDSWMEVPNSRMQAVCPSESQFPGICGICCCCDGVISLWSGGAFDSKRNRLIVWGGGHRGYYGNELYTFDLDDFKWERVTDPSPPNQPAYCPAILPGGAPSSRHTYYNIDYLSSTDRFFSAPTGGTACDVSGNDPNTWTFDFDFKKWTVMIRTGEKAHPGTSAAGAYDPVSDRFYFALASSDPSRGGLWVYDVKSNAWSHPNSSQDWYWQDHGAAVDTKRGLFVVVGSGDVVVYDIGKNNFSPQVWNTTGGGSAISGRPGVNYDPVADRIVAWDGGAVYALNLDMRVWEQKATAPQATTPNGTYGRFRYSPLENAYAVVNSVDQNVLLYKLTAGPGTNPSAVQNVLPAGLEGSVVAFPNPFSRFTTIVQWNTGPWGSPKALAIYNAAGRRVHRLGLGPESLASGVVWYAGGLPAGVYWLQIRYADHREISKPLMIDR